MSKYHITVGSQVAPNELLELYNLCGWNKGNWRSIDMIQQAIERSTLMVTARLDEGPLIGCARVVGDGVFVNQIVDLMVHPAYRGQGVATMMLERIVTFRATKKVKKFCDLPAIFLRQHNAQAPERPVIA